jgi:dGTPase
MSASEGHVYHNRLTHTLKVAQVGRRLAENLRSDASGAGFDIAERGPDPDVVEAAALAHDIGHPPFGHVVEKELQRLLAEVGVDDSFEGNAQSFRIVTRVALVSERHQGLNLTRASLAALLKYPWIRDPGHAKAAEKWGAYDADIDDFRFALGLEEGDGLPSPGGVRAVEAAIMDWADDITYAIHDLEDLWRAGLIPADQLAARDAVREDFGQWVSNRWQDRIDRGLPAPSSDIAGIREALEVFPLLFGSYEPYDGTAGQGGGGGGGTP